MNDLTHYGVKGMKWGVTKDEAVLRKIAGDNTQLKPSGGTRSERRALKKQVKRDWKAYKKSTTSKERKEDRVKARQEKMSYILDTVSNDKSAMVVTRGAYGHKVILSGSDFVTHMVHGGLMDVPSTEISHYRLEWDEHK